jgi:hypothetical protein
MTLSGRGIGKPPGPSAYEFVSLSRDYPSEGPCHLSGSSDWSNRVQRIDSWIEGKRIQTWAAPSYKRVDHEGRLEPPVLVHRSSVTEPQ